MPQWFPSMPLLLTAKQAVQVARILFHARKIVRICYGQDGAWIGTQNIGKDKDFIASVHSLGVLLGTFKLGR